MKYETTILKANISEWDCFLNVFSDIKYIESVKFLKRCGSLHRTSQQNVPMYCFGSTNFACNSPRFLLKSGKTVMLPRPYANFRPKRKKFEMFKEDCIGLMKLIVKLERFCFSYLNDLRKKEEWAHKAYNYMCSSKICVPSCCRIYNTAFTFFSLNGNLESNENGIGSHIDKKDSFNLVLHIGECSIGGATLYFKGKGTQEIQKKVPFVNGNIQIGHFSFVYHGTEGWVGKRCSLTFTVKHSIVEYFSSYGNMLYNKYIVNNNYECPNICIEADDVIHIPKI